MTDLILKQTRAFAKGFGVLMLTLPEKLELKPGLLIRIDFPPKFT
jgi:hypothetical protein